MPDLPSQDELDGVKPESVARAFARMSDVGKTLVTLARRQHARVDKGCGVVGSATMRLWAPYVEHAAKRYDEDPEAAEAYLFAALHATQPFAAEARRIDSEASNPRAFMPNARAYEEELALIYDMSKGQLASFIQNNRAWLSRPQISRIPWNDQNELFAICR